MEPDEKILWLLGHEFIFKPELHHEVFTVLQDNYPKASKLVKNKLIKYSESRIFDSKYKNEEIDAFEVFKLLLWLQRSSPDDKNLKKLVENILEKFPDFEQPDEHADFLMWHSEVKVVESPYSAEELLSFEPETPFFKNIIYYYPRGAKNIFGSGGRIELMRELEKAISTKFSMGWSLSTVLIKERRWQSDIWAAIYGGWNKAKLTSTEWKKILELTEKLIVEFKFGELESTEEWSSLLLDIRELTNSKFLGIKSTDNWLRAICYLLRDGSENKDACIPDEFLEKSETLVSDLWPRILNYDYTGWKQNDPFFVVINTPAGLISMFWMSTLTRRYELNREHWTSIPFRHKDFINSIIEQHNYPSDIALHYVSGYMGYLYGLDNTWTEETLFSLLDWDHKEKSQIAWSGLLQLSNWNITLYDALLPRIKKTIKHMDNLKNARKLFIKLLAQFFLYLTKDFISDWLKEFSKYCTLEDYSVFSDWVSKYLMQKTFGDDEKRSTTWASKLKPFLEFRINNIQKMPVSKEEVIHYYRWMNSMPTVFPEFTNIIIKIDTEFDPSFVFYALVREGFAETFAEKTYDFAMFLLNKKFESIIGGTVENFKTLAKIFKEKGISIEKIALFRKKLLSLGIIAKYLEGI